MSTLTITFVQPDESVRVLDNIQPDRTLMEVARENNIQGILADCGGGCTCATCHVYVDPPWRETVGPADGVEEGVLDMVESVQPGRSRLSCQIKLRPELDGLTVTVAKGS